MKMSLEDIMTGKTVVLVGWAPYLKGAARGEWIDSHDVVVRVNGHHTSDTISKGRGNYNPRDYGSRCDVLYLCSSVSKCPTRARKILHESGDVKWVVLKAREYSTAQQLSSSNTTCLTTDSKIDREIGRTKQYAPLTGTIAMAHLLSMEISLLSVCGFDYHLSQNPRPMRSLHNRRKDSEYALGITDERFRPDPEFVAACGKLRDMSDAEIEMQGAETYMSPRGRLVHVEPGSDRQKNIHSEMRGVGGFPVDWKLVAVNGEPLPEYYEAFERSIQHVRNRY